MLVLYCGRPCWHGQDEEIVANLIFGHFFDDGTRVFWLKKSKKFFFQNQPKNTAKKHRGPIVEKMVKILATIYPKLPQTSPDEPL